MIHHATGTFQTGDSLTLHTESWLPDSVVKAVVLIVHGLGEHIARYGHVAAQLNQAGYAVYGLDHRGHGKSGGEKAYFASFDDPVNDLKRYFDQVKAAQPGKKIFLYGHSLGSLMTLAFTQRYQSELAGIIISGTPLDIERTQPKPLVIAAGVLNALVPKAAITPPLPSSYLSHDPAIVNGYDADPLVYHGNVRVRMGYQIMHVSREIRANMNALKLPVFIFHGAGDKLCPPSGSDILYKGMGSADKTLKMYPDLFHESHNEPQKDQVVQDIITWLDTRV